VGIVTAQLAPQHEIVSELMGRVGLADAYRPFEGRAQVVDLGFDLLSAPHRAGEIPRDVELRTKLDGPGEVTIAGGRCLAGVEKPLAGRTGAGLEHPVPAGVVVGIDHGLVDEREEDVEHVDRVDAIAAATCSAASRVKPSTKTVRRRNAARSRSVRRS
jgi:hypothetical protein